jgi:hypothetical protein
MEIMFSDEDRSPRDLSFGAARRKLELAEMLFKNFQAFLEEKVKERIQEEGRE